MPTDADPTRPLQLTAPRPRRRPRSALIVLPWVIACGPVAVTPPPGVVESAPAEAAETATGADNRDTDEDTHVTLDDESERGHVTPPPAAESIVSDDSIPLPLTCVSPASLRLGDDGANVTRVTIGAPDDDVTVRVVRGPQFFSHEGTWQEPQQITADHSAPLVINGGRLSAAGGLVDTIRYLEIETLSDTGCAFSNGELFQGLIGPFVARGLRRSLRRGFTALGESLKDRAEALWRERSGGAR